MERALTTKNKLEMGYGSMSQPPVNSPNFKAWKKCNKVISWITNYVSKDIVISILYITKAEDAWKYLKTWFSQENGPRTFQLQKTIAGLAQESNSVSTYYTQFKGIWDEFSNYCPIPNCSCGKCTFGSMQSVSEFHSQVYIYHFSMGLNNQFSTVHGQIFLMEPFPLFNKVFSMILQDERQREISSSAGNIFTNSAAFMSRAPAPIYSGAPTLASRSPAPISSFNRGGFRTNSNGHRDKPTCSHCGIVGQTIDKCYKIHGFPPGFKFTRSKPHFNPSAHQV